MKERVLNAIYEKLEADPENKNLQRQIILINKASICTIDSFCLDVVKNNFFELENISPNFRIGDTSEVEILKQEVLEEIFEKKYEENDEAFLKLINTYTSYKDDSPLKDMILKIYTYIQSSPFPEKWLDEHIEMFNLKDKLEEDFSSTQWGKILLEEVKEELIDDIKTLQDIDKPLLEDENLEKFEQTIAGDIKQFETLESNLDNWNRSYEIYNNINFSTWPRNKVDSEIKDEAKKIRDYIKKKFNNKLSKILISDSKNANQDIYSMHGTLKNLQNLILEFGQEFSKKKREKNLVDFSDIEHFALNILLKVDENGNVEQTEIAKKYQEKYEEIAIDEYQDSNLVQEYIMTAVSKNNNIFMVGDVKQSIYKFRQAMPELFLSKYNTYKGTNDRTQNQDLKIQLFKNFRSRKNILDFTNIVFENIMSSKLGDVDYTEEEFLNLGSSDYEEANQNLKTEIDIIDVKEDEKSYVNSDIQEHDEGNDDDDDNNLERLENVELEARYVAHKIKNLIESKYQIYDRKNKNFRDITYKDIVILLRSTKDKANIFERELINLNMPVFSDTSQEYLDSIEIDTVMSVLKIIDNPIQDIPLVAVLRSSIGNFTDNELIQIRLSDKQDDFYTAMRKARIDVDSELSKKIETFLEQLQQWRKEQEYLALDELIWKIIYVDTNYYNDVLKMPNGIIRQENLKMLFERAKQYEKASFKGLYNFIKFIEKIKLSSGDLGAAKLIGENDNVIRIMSIHKSKGLEFPVVFLANTAKQFNMQDVKLDPILLNQDLGIGAKYIDYNMQVEYDTLTRAAVKNKILNENISEEMRILYVALTRAKEKLFITAVMNDAKKDMDNLEIQKQRYKKTDGKINLILLKKYKRYIDWILLVNLYEKEKMKDIADVEILKKKDIMSQFKELEDKEKEQRDSKNIEESEKFEQTDSIKHTSENKSEKWKYKYILSTTIPTKTSVTKLKGNEEEKISFAKPEFLRTSKKEQITNAKKGTLTHLCMQKLDENVEYNIDKITQLVQDLVLRNIVTKEEANAINKYKILEFTKSDIWQEMKNAKEIYKEKPFYINIPVSEIYKEEFEEHKEHEHNKEGKENIYNDLNDDILVQGIIDLYYINENNELVLVDYKTDYVEKGKEQELIEKYKSQLELYKKALEKALNRQVDKIYIYSVYLGKPLKHLGQV